MRGRGYSHPSGTIMRFNFSSSLGTGRVMNKYMRIGYEDEECKTRPHLAPLPCLMVTLSPIFTLLTSQSNSDFPRDFLADQRVKTKRKLKNETFMCMPPLINNLSLNKVILPISTNNIRS